MTIARNVVIWGYADKRTAGHRVAALAWQTFGQRAGDGGSLALQRLLFLLTGVELPGDNTSVQRERFEAAQGGTLVQMGGPGLSQRSEGAGPWCMNKGKIDA